MRQALAAERAGGPTEEAEHPFATARTIRASPEDDQASKGRENRQNESHPSEKGY